jgi:ubiquinone/menaquinone biosynthesis C-methylase UbiE
MRRHRRALLAAAHGRVLEIGAGTGLNVPHYPDGLVELILAEPDPSMHRRLLRRDDGRATVVAASADRLPVADASVDTVVSTLVLCTVEDPEATLLEIRRVLRPDGQLLLIEHVRAHGRSLAAAQRLLRGPWSRFARGCRCDQRTVEILHACGFRSDLRRGRWHAMPPIVAPLVVGRAVPTAMPAS